MSGERGGRRRNLDGRGVEGSRRGARVGDALLMEVLVCFLVYGPLVSSRGALMLNGARQLGDWTDYTATRGFMRDLEL